MQEVPIFQIVSDETNISLLSIQSFPSIEVDYDYIEVNDGWFLKLSSRSFVRSPFRPEQFGKMAPRCYKDFTVGTVCDGGVFADSIVNSFPELGTRVNFLNKFYQCLLCFQFPHKVPRVLTVGKTFKSILHFV